MFSLPSENYAIVIIVRERMIAESHRGAASRYVKAEGIAVRRRRARGGLSGSKARGIPSAKNRRKREYANSSERERGGGR